MIIIIYYRLDFRNFLNPVNDPQDHVEDINNSDDHDWPPLDPNNCDIVVGGLTAEVVNQTLIKWVLDGATKVNRKDKKDIAKILKRLRHALKLHGKKLKE